MATTDEKITKMMKCMTTSAYLRAALEPLGAISEILALALGDAPEIAPEIAAARDDLKSVAERLRSAMTVLAAVVETS